MTDHDALLRAICDDPEDNTPRLAFADWLEEHGEVGRAEFIRLDIAHESMDGEALMENEDRWMQLLDEHVTPWMESLAGEGITWGDDEGPLFDRGFPISVVAESWEVFAPAAERLFAAAPITRLTIRDTVMADGEAMANCPLLARVEYLALPAAGVSAQVVRALAGSPYLGRVSQLVLPDNIIGVPGIQALADSTALPRLASLNLNFDFFINDEAARILAGAPSMAGLKALSLGGRRTVGGPFFTNAAVAALAGSPLRLHRLCLNCNGITDEGARLLAASPAFAELWELQVTDNLLTDEAAWALASSLHLPDRLTVCLAGNHLSPAGVQALQGRFKKVYAAD
jgi:uncharacterized protein (TIGR02996 family)